MILGRSHLPGHAASHVPTEHGYRTIGLDTAAGEITHSMRTVLRLHLIDLTTVQTHGEWPPRQIATLGGHGWRDRDIREVFHRNNHELAHTPSGIELHIRPPRLVMIGRHIHRHVLGSQVFDGNGAVAVG